MAAYRCSQCNTNWPQTGDYQKCPACETPTWRSNNTPIPDSEAESRTKLIAFEKYAREWEDKRAIEEENVITETKTRVAGASGKCSLCGFEMRSAFCHHPWRKPFDDWPAAFREQVIAAAPAGWDPDPSKK